MCALGGEALCLGPGRAGSGLGTWMAAGQERDWVGVSFGGKLTGLGKGWDVGGKEQETPKLPPNSLAQNPGRAMVPFPEMGKTQGGTGLERKRTLLLDVLTSGYNVLPSG